MSVAQGSGMGNSPATQHCFIPIIRPKCPVDQGLYHQILLALDAARHVTILTGAGISTSAGIPDFRSADGIYNSHLPGLSRGNLGLRTFDARTLQDPQQLRTYGRTMAALRIACRNAKPTACHEYIAKLNARGRLLRCYTQNIDGLQTRNQPHLAKVVLELHGNIHRLRCNRCGQSPDANAEDIDNDLLRDGFVQCQKCQQRGKGGAGSHWGLRPLSPGILLPQVLHNEGSWEAQLNGLTMDKLEQVDGLASLLLIIGTSIRTDGAARLVKSLAKKIHQAGGMVIYIDRVPLAERKWTQYIDVQLKTNIETWAVHAIQWLGKVSSRRVCLSIPIKLESEVVL